MLYYFTLVAEDFAKPYLLYFVTVFFKFIVYRILSVVHTGFYYFYDNVFAIIVENLFLLTINKSMFIVTTSKFNVTIKSRVR